MRIITGKGVLVLSLSACGRIGFAPIAGDGGTEIDARPPNDVDASVCAATEGPSGNSTCADGIDNDCDLLVDAIDPDCESNTCLVVTTQTDENDNPENRLPPHLGAGLSLREAIEIANSATGPDCIVFSSPMTIAVASALPSIVGNGGLRINGGQKVTIEKAGSVDVGLQISSNNNVIVGMHIRGIAEASGICIDTRMNDNTIGPGVEIDNCDIGIKVLGERNTVTGSRLHHNAIHGVQLSPGTVDATVNFSLLHNNQDDGLQTMSVAGLLFQHNTVYGNSIGLDAKTASNELVLTNNLFVENSVVGVDGADSTFTSLDYNGYFNTGQNCLGCSIGTNSITTNPLLADPNTGDFSLSPGSPAIDSGTDTGLDTNGSAPGLFDGLGPDLGAIESSGS